MTRRTALKMTRRENFAQWYQELIEAAELGEHSGVRGCMIIRPWAYAIWERIQRRLDDMIRTTGHENCYFPVFIPLDLIEKEMTHVHGFAKEMAVVTHHRVVADDNGKLVPEGALETPLIVRPTSEAMFSSAFSRWIQSYRDLPLKLNQWANVVRWEMRPRLFLRTSEFLWQEGHTAHTSAAEAEAESATMLECYRALVEDFMAIPVTGGLKSVGERFPGAVATHTIEAMMQDGRALQVGTSHYLGQNFATANEIQYLDKEGQLQTPFTTSWGVSTRLIGALIMTHGDDDGLRLPPQLAPDQIIILPLTRDASRAQEVNDACATLAAQLRALDYRREPLRVRIDARDIKPADKRWGWVKKGAPLVLEIGARDLDAGQVMMYRRDRLVVGGEARTTEAFVGGLVGLFDSMYADMFATAQRYRADQSVYRVTSMDEMRAFFEKGQGFVHAKWRGDIEHEELLKEFNVTIRCLPYDQSGTEGRCVATGRKTTTDAIFAKAY